MQCHILITFTLNSQITGTGHGIGRELAIRFAKLGSTLVCVDVNAKGNEETVKMINGKKGKVFQYQ